MDEQQQRIVEDLSGLFRGELCCDRLTASLYASDAGLYQMSPLGVAYPQDRDDVVTLARYSAETDLPLIARGAGTGIAGGAIGSGLIVDFSRHMRNVVSVDEETVRVQPGIVRDALNRILKKHDRYFAPDPSNAAITTVGGMLAVDAAGSHSVRVGSTRDHVQSLELVLASGVAIEVANESLEILKSSPGHDGDRSHDLNIAAADAASRKIKRTILSKLSKILADNEELIRRHQPALIRNCCGYYLRGILNDEHLHLPRLLVGSEGTLGLFTEATLHTTPLTAHRGVVLLLFGEMEAALHAVQVIAPQQPSACDLLDRRLLSLAREADERFEKLISPAAETALIVEQTGYSERQSRERIKMVIDAVRSLNQRVEVAHEAYTFDDVEFLWSLPAKVVPLLTKLHGMTRPVPFVEDVAVPPEALHDFLIHAQKVFQKHKVTATLYSHAAAGQVHLRPFLPTPTPQDGERLESISRDLYQAVFAVGGTISGEHGDGLSRTAFVRSQYGPLYKVFQQIKDLFDPHCLMNPGKIVSDDPHITMRNIRPATGSVPETIPLQLQWNTDELTEATLRCNGCGTCRTQSPELRMCPFFRFDSSERNSPRAKANLIRNVLNGVLDPLDLSTETTKELADLCFNCKQCQLECPSNVNIPQMMIETKAAYVAANGLNRSDWILSRTHSLGTFGRSFTPVLNYALGNRTARWAFEKFLGIARERKLPRFSRRPFLQTMSDEQRDPALLTNPESSVVYFIGDYANFYDPELATAFVAVLKHHGIHVHVPEGQTSSGMAMISAGDLQSARTLAEHNVRELAELAREGFSILCTEPTTALCLKQEYRMLIDHPDVELVADQVMEAGTFLQQLHVAGRLKTDFEPLDLDVGYHTPCHLKALEVGTPLFQIMDLIPGLTLHRIEEGCSGMAGVFGLSRENFQTSIQLGEKLITRMQATDLNIGATECSSCKMQMEQGTTTPTLHPIKLLALAYGLMPEIRDKLKPTTGNLKVS
ncbi:MAG: anaerobic glycerol-3-phosphate dehydrogenase subunit C [Planctomycetes bacterium]|nr:anaerobic glycerol-3-phosphate dehydrogenase subunit C [Planctomycetota bacterium]